MLTQEDMLTQFSPASEPYRPMVGFEYEIQCFNKQTLSPIAYYGRQGWQKILVTTARLTGGELLVDEEAPTKVSLPDKGLLSLEPGGQLEFSSAPRESFQETMGQLSRFQCLLQELGNAYDLHYFFGGTNPVHTLDQTPLVTPTQRYLLMDHHFATSGTMGHRMMRQTSSIQVTFDFKNQEQGEDLLKTAQYIAPFAAAIFSNAPYMDGRRIPYLSNRISIWSNTDPSRCGPLPGFTEPTFGFDSYIEFIRRAPMLFVKDRNRLLPAKGLTFDRFIEEGFHGRKVTIEDFNLHNSTIFTDVRLKRTVEVRTVDSQDPVLFPAVVAFLGGILHCERSRLRAKHLLKEMTASDFRSLPDTLGRDGLRGVIRGQPVRELVESLLDLAATGLPTCFSDGTEAVSYLDPIRELVAQEMTPADVVIKNHGDNAFGWLAAGRTFGQSCFGKDTLRASACYS